MENNWLDIQHRGFTAYLDETADRDACKKLNRAIISADRSDERMDTVFLDCEVDTDWVQRIEAALPFLENAVRQSRQFILRQGQTVPIEKVKRVSRASVEHLSRHSELITTQPRPEEDLVPDRLYMTENVGTYTVYENRFLYMLLCLVRDFAGSRYRKISALAASFSTDIALDKQIDDGTRKLHYCLKYSEVSRGMEESAADGALDRLRNILQAVELLLRTDLMKEVSTAPILKPPVTRTNVLLHDPNFKAAYELYAFLSAYDGDGFTAVERHRQSGAFSDDARYDLAALVALTSYLSYRCGGSLEQLEQRRRAAAEREARERIAALKDRLGPLDDGALAYIDALERRNTELEGREDRLYAQEKLREELHSRLEELQAGKAALEDALSEKERQIDSLTEQNVQAQARQAEERQWFEEEKQRQEQQFRQEYEALAEKYLLACALSRSLSEQESCCTPEAFARLEAEFEAFKRFYEQQWKLAKKHIRKEKLWKK